MWLRGVNCGEGHGELSAPSPPAAATSFAAASRSLGFTRTKSSSFSFGSLPMTYSLDRVERGWEERERCGVSRAVYSSEG